MARSAGIVATLQRCRDANEGFRERAHAHEDPFNQVIGFVRELYDNVVLTVVNLSDQDFTGHQYGVGTGGRGGQWTQILCTQDRDFGGWDGVGNAFYEPWTQADGKIYINLPKWSVVMFRKK